MSFAKRLKKVRQEKGFSQQDLAELAGVHYTQIGRYENKGANPASDVLAKIANALGVTSDYLMGGTLDDVANNSISDKELLNQFKLVEKLPSERKKIVVELIEAFLIKTELQKRLAH